MARRNHPVPLLFSATLIYAGMLLGLYCSQRMLRLVSSSLWMWLGVAALAAFYVFTAAAHYAHTAFAALAVLAAAALATFSFGLYPLLASDFGALPVAHTVRAFVVAVATYCVLLVISIYVVAYKFAPGGWLLRERHSALFVVVGLSIWLYYKRRLASTTLPAATATASSLEAATASDESDEHHKRKSSVARSASQIATQSVLSVPHQIIARSILVLFTVCFFTPTLLYRFYSLSHSLHSVQPAAHGKANELHTGIWTIHFGYDNS